MIAVPGDHVRIGRAPVTTVAEAYLHAGHLVEVVTTSGRVWWVDPDQVRVVAPVTSSPRLSERT